MMLLGGIGAEQEVEKVLTFAEKLLLWVQDPDHWVPAGIIILGIFVWRWTGSRRG